MQADDIIVIGDKIELTLEGNRVYKSKVEDISETGLILVTVPTLWGMYAPIYAGEKISLGFFRESAWYTSTMEVESFVKQGEAHFVWLLQVTPPHRHQRREAYRLPVRLKVKVREYTDGMEKDLVQSGSGAGHVEIEEANTRDVSIGGLAITTKRFYEPGERYLLEVFLDETPDRTRPFLVCAEVMRAAPTSDNRANSIGLQFKGVTNNGNEVLSKYVLTRQQKLIQQRKL